MNVDKLLLGESKNVEYKVSRPEKSVSYMKSVIAFANSAGGHLLFGVEDRTRTIVGIPEDIVFQEMDAITNAISDSCEPVIVPDVYPQTIDGKTIIIVEISPGKQRPYYMKSEGLDRGTYIRVSNTSRKADRNTIKELYYTSEGRSFDTVIRTDIAISEDEINQLCRDMREVALANCKNGTQRQSVKIVTKNVLLNWGILAETDRGDIYPTNAFVFLTGRDVFLSRIQCGMFKGNSRAVFVDKRDYEGPLWQQVEEVFQFVLRNIHLGAKIEGIYRQDIYELPPDSIRELIINAVMNCSFLQASHIQVAIFEDRLEITSPGGLLPGVTVDRMKEGYSQIRNRALAHAFSYMNMIEGWGTGIPKLIREMGEYGLREPEFIDMEIALRINLYRMAEEGIKVARRIEEKERSTGYQMDGGQCGIVSERPAGYLMVQEDTMKYGRLEKRIPETLGSAVGGIQKMPGSAAVYLENAGECRIMPENNWNVPLERIPLSEQQAKLYRAIKEKGQITSSEAEQILGVKQRRARAVLKSMVDSGLIVKTGAAQHTKYLLMRK